MPAQHGDQGGGWKAGGRLTPWKAGPRLAAAARAALDTLLPAQTLDGGPAQSSGLAGEAWGRISFISDPLCDGCGLGFEFDPGPGVRCAACTNATGPVARTRAACVYDDYSRDMILRLKHADRTDLAGVLSRWVERAAADLIAQADAVAPVPLHRWRHFHRRFNQAAEIARPLARRNGLAFLPDALVRTKATQSQGGKSGDARRRNVAGAFAVPPGKQRLVEGRRILLVDDVLTTGATARACARALRAAGAASVDLAVAARVQEASGGAIG